MKSTTLTVLLTAKLLKNDSNPYIRLFANAVDPHVHLTYFSWNNALFSRYDVAHFQWPEYIFRGGNPLKQIVKGVLGTLFLLRISTFRIPIVHTVHNIRPHETPNRIENWLNRWFMRLVTINIYLNEDDSNDMGCGVVLLHGRYENTLIPVHGNCTKGSILTFGLLRPYKGIEHLIEAFSQLDNESLSLQIVGHAPDEDYGRHIRLLASADSRISVELEFVSDEKLEALIENSQLVVLPYTKLYNSGAAILALGLSTPILVPNGGSTQALEKEVGEGWVTRFAGNLHSADLLQALNNAPKDGEPNLERRDWKRIGLGHAKLYDVVTVAADGWNRNSQGLVSRQLAEIESLIADQSHFNRPSSPEYPER